MAESNFAAASVPKAPVARETVNSVCGELGEVILLLKSLHYFACQDSSYQPRGGEAFVLAAEHLAVRGIRMIDDCIEELGGIIQGNFRRSVFEEERDRPDHKGA